jgi:transposase
MVPASLQPDLNPIEMAFAKLKSPRRRETARALETLDPAVARSLASFRPHHGQNSFRPAHRGTV